MRRLFVAVSGLGGVLAVAAGACGGNTTGSPAGGLRQACYGNGTCDEGLTCFSVHVCYRDSSRNIWDAWYDASNNVWNLQQLSGPIQINV
jgi:hypothetical protein